MAVFFYFVIIFYYCIDFVMKTEEKPQKLLWSFFFLFLNYYLCSIIIFIVQFLAFLYLLYLLYGTFHVLIERGEMSK